MAALDERLLSGRLAGASRVAESREDVGRAPALRPRLLDQVHAALRLRHYSRRTERAYVGWIRRVILFHGKRHPREMGADEVTEFPSALAVDRKVSASTQAAARPLQRHIERVRRLHAQDLGASAGWVELPNALARKYPNAGRELPWQWVFPATRFYVDRVTGQRRRHHLHETVVQRAVHVAVRAAGIQKPASCHTFRHSFATHLRSIDGTASCECRSPLPAAVRWCVGHRRWNYSRPLSIPRVSHSGLRGRCIVQ